MNIRPASLGDPARKGRRRLGRFRHAGRVTVTEKHSYTGVFFIELLKRK
jgi:hypothetical protein